jgi:hypothetical protein
MPFYPVMPPDVTCAGGEDAAPGLSARAGMVAVRAADLASPCGRGLGRDGRTGLVAAGAGRLRPGDRVVLMKQNEREQLRKTNTQRKRVLRSQG